jgi:hypothetical protein
VVLPVFVSDLIRDGRVLHLPAGWPVTSAKSREGNAGETKAMGYETISRQSEDDAPTVRAQRKNAAVASHALPNGDFWEATPPAERAN